MCRKEQKVNRQGPWIFCFSYNIIFISRYWLRMVPWWTVISETTFSNISHQIFIFPEFKSLSWFEFGLPKLWIKSGIPMVMGGGGHHLQNPKWLLGGPKMADGVWSSPSLRKDCDGEKEKWKIKKMEKKIMFIVTTNVVVSRPPECWLTGMPHARANRC